MKFDIKALIRIEEETGDNLLMMTSFKEVITPKKLPTLVAAGLDCSREEAMEYIEKEGLRDSLINVAKALTASMSVDDTDLPQT